MSGVIRSEVKPTRPVLRWHGGKWKLAPWIISHFPEHRVYVEPFGGAASVLLRKERVHGEVYNDLDEEVVNLFRVMQCPRSGPALVAALEMTPYARLEFELAYEACEDPLERARRMVIRSFMGFGTNSATPKSSGRGFRIATGFRANSNRSGNVPARDWTNIPEALELSIERFRGVTIECQSAVRVMEQHDEPVTLHYIDPPYLPETRMPSGGRFTRKMYRFEMTADEHVELLTTLRRLTGMVLLSGYPSGLYDEALSDWQRVEMPSLADGAEPRTEVLWLNPACVAARKRDRGQACLFDEAAE